MKILKIKKKRKNLERKRKKRNLLKLMMKKFLRKRRKSQEKMEVVEMIPGYTHNIINLSETEDMVTFMWANESFDPNRPDTFFEEV